MRNNKEHNQQVMVFNWRDLNAHLYPCLKYMYAIPNAGQRHPAVGAKMKAEGLKPGMLDFCLPWPKEDLQFKNFCVRELYDICGLYIEMKTPPKQPSKISTEQKDCLKYLISVGYEAHVAWSADEAIEIIKNYINPDETRWVDFQ